MYFLTKGHCFVDGNKRVGLTAPGLLLKLNGFHDQLEDKLEGYYKTMEIAASNISESERDGYIKEGFRKID